jgi:hypothetical protein
LVNHVDHGFDCADGGGQPEGCRWITAENAERSVENVAYA